VEIGLEVFLAKAYKKYRGMRLGVLCNQASLDSKLRHISETILDKKLGLKIGCFLGPQHGIRGEKQDNMVESPDFTDPRSKLPVFSLYASTREPTDRMLEHLDAFVVDLQDIGTRIYTFMYTMANCMIAAKRTGKKVIVLDRPNPIGGELIEGNVLEKEYASFVGQYPMSARHGMTIGEIAGYFNQEFGIGCDLEVVKIQGWKRSQYADQWKRDWVPPSPNIPCLGSALTFPGSVLFEGTNISEARGTTRPFEWIGAPFIDADTLASAMQAKKLPGVYFRPIYFQPTYQKCKDEICGGVQIHITDRAKFNAFKAGIHLLDTIVNMYPKQFAWKQPPYEYEHVRMPIDLIAGTARLRGEIESGRGLKNFEEAAAKELAAFRRIRSRYLLYRG
jgi:uncharacterized protein YbbC (DUF1343 family)